MSLDEFRADDKLVAELKKVFDNPTFRTAIACVRDSGGPGPTPVSIEPTAALIRLGMLEQHPKTINALLSLSKYPVDLNVDNEEMQLDEEK